jgi:hypothetical protein
MDLALMQDLLLVVMEKVLIRLHNPMQMECELIFAEGNLSNSFLEGKDE